jgi:hypothetical protein
MLDLSASLLRQLISSFQLIISPAAYGLALANHGGVAAHDMRGMRSACLPSSLRARMDQYTEQELLSIDISGLHSLSP